MNILVLTSLIGLIFTTLTACTPLAVSGAVGASAVVSSTAAPLPTLENITEVRFLPLRPAEALLDCTHGLTRLSIERSGSPTLKLPTALRQPAQIEAYERTGCKKISFDVTSYYTDPRFIEWHTISLKEQHSLDIVGFFNARQYRWQKGVPIRSYPAIHPRKIATSHELRFYRDSELVQTIKFEYNTLLSSIHGQAVHRELSVEEWKWLNERIPLAQSASPRHPLRDHLGERNFALRDRLQ